MMNVMRYTKVCLWNALRSLPIAAAIALPMACDASRREAQRWETAQGEVAETWVPETLATVMGLPSTAIQAAIEERLDGDPPANAGSADWRRVHILYDAHGQVPLWLDEDGLVERAGQLTNAITHAPSDGLALSAYPIDELHDAVATLRRTDQPTAEQLADLDLLLSTAYVLLATDMHAGQIDPRRVSQAWHVALPESDVDTALVRTFRSDLLDAGIAGLRPQAENFEFLRTQLGEFREIVARGGWGTVPEGDVLEPGDTSTVERLAALRARLLAERYIERLPNVVPLRDTSGLETDRAVLDSSAAGALALFQDRHGIVVDSILGPSTLASLNESAEYRVRQVAANLERYRWLPPTLGDRYVFVNVPAFRLDAYDEGERVLEMKVIVGSEYNQRATPAFSDSMSYVVFRPYWNIPENIALEELLPAAGGNPAYLASRSYEVVGGAGDGAPMVGQYVPSAEAIQAGEVRIRERPGPRNALGLVKFMFPNDFAIYLHDTPEDGLFEEDIRAFSHGCIRVEDPVALARYVLAWDEGRIREAMTRGPDSRRVDLERKLPVYILYLTTYRRDGELWFGNDLYDRDRALTEAVAEGAMPDPAWQQRAAALHELVAR